MPDPAQGRPSPGGAGRADAAIAGALDVSPATVERVRARHAREGVEAALARRRPAPRKLDRAREAHLVALACSPPPGGTPGGRCARWAVASSSSRRAAPVSHEPVRRTLKKDVLKPWLRRRGCTPPREGTESVRRAEDVLDVDARPDAPRFPLMCLDEAGTQPLADSRPPLAPAPGRAAGADHEYPRRGTANCFMPFEPLCGRRHVVVTERRTKADWAHGVRDLVDVRHSAAERVVLVLDNLNAHSPASLDAAFPPDEAKRIADHLELHHTPKQGSWLNMAAVEPSVPRRRRLDRRLPDAATAASSCADSSHQFRRDGALEPGRPEVEAFRSDIVLRAGVASDDPDAACGSADA